MDFYEYLGDDNVVKVGNIFKEVSTGYLYEIKHIENMGSYKEISFISKDDPEK